MAKKTETVKKEKVASFKDVLFDSIGVALAGLFPDNDVKRVKPIGGTECVLVDVEGKHYTIAVTEKKKAIEFEAEDVKRDYTEEALNASEGE